MSLNIEQAYEQQRRYRGNTETTRALGGISVMMFIGPSASGKNFLMEHSGLPIARTITNRDKRPSDGHGLYSYVPQHEILQSIENGDLAQYGVALPDHIYATAPTSYHHGTTNVKDVWYDAVGQFHNAGFKDVKTVSVLTPDPAQYRSQLMLRLEGSTVAAAHARLGKDLNGLKWIAAQMYAGTHNNLVVLNEFDNVDKNADRINRFADSVSVDTVNMTAASEAVRAMSLVIQTVRERF